jgi:hypothetical protein
MTAPRHSRPALYLTVVCGLTLVLWLLPIGLLRMPAWERWDQTYFGPLLDSPFTASGIDADIVVFGDSSAIYGFDPHAVATALGLRVLNLPSSVANLQINGDRGLQSYLHRNKPPRLIVFYLTPWDLDYEHIPPNPGRYEAEEILLRHGSAVQILRFAATHRRDALWFPIRFYHVHHPSAVLHGVLHPNRQSLAATMGHESLLEAGMPAACTLPVEFLDDARSTTSASRLLARYKTANTRTIVYVAPVPACDNAAPLHHPYPELAAAAPLLLPPPSFVDGGHDSHIQAAALPVTTRAFIDAIPPVLNAHALSTLSTTEQSIPISNAPPWPRSIPAP